MATFVGTAVAVFAQLTGIDFIIFYSNTIFKKTSNMDETTITEVCNLVNFVTTLGGVILLKYAGRRTIMLYSNAAMAIILVLVGLSI